MFNITYRTFIIFCRILLASLLLTLFFPKYAVFDYALSIAAVILALILTFRMISTWQEFLRYILYVIRKNHNIPAHEFNVQMATIQITMIIGILYSVPSYQFCDPLHNIIAIAGAITIPLIMFIVLLFLDLRHKFFRTFLNVIFRIKGKRQPCCDKSTGNSF